MTTIPWHKILDIAKNAPSGGNSQPWSVTIKEKKITLSVADKIKSHANAYEYLAAFLSLGTLSYNVVKVTEAFGFETFMDVLDEQVVITVIGERPNLKDEAMMDVIRSRCTNRKPTEHTIHADIMTALEHALAHYLKDSDRDFLTLARTRDPTKIAEIADTLSQAERLRFSFQPTQNKLFEEIKCDERDAFDKIALKALELPWVVEKFMCMAIHRPALRKLILPSMLARIVKSQLIKSSDLACFYCDEPPTLRQLIHLGQAVQFFWLTLTQYHYSIQPWTSLTFYHLETFYDRPLTFSSKEEAEIMLFVEEMNQAFGKEKKLPLFFFRIHDAAPPLYRSSKRSLSIEGESKDF